MLYDRTAVLGGEATSLWVFACGRERSDRAVYTYLAKHVVRMMNLK